METQESLIKRNESRDKLIQELNNLGYLVVTYDYNCRLPGDERVYPDISVMQSIITDKHGDYMECEIDSIVDEEADDMDFLCRK
jgi:hypothetical protein